MKKPIHEEKIMQRRAVKVYFDDEDMDFNLMWVLGNSGADGAELGECMRAASQIKDPESWVAEWTKAAVLKTAARKRRGFESLLLRWRDNQKV